MKKQEPLNPTKSISVAFLLGFIAIAGLLTYVTIITKNGSFDTRTKATLVIQTPSCTGTGMTCMTPKNCQSMHAFNIGKLNCVGTLVCCSSRPPPTPAPALKPYIIAPKAADTWERGKTYQITWYENIPATSTGLFLYTRSGTVDTYIGAIAYYVSNVVGTNTYSWTIPVQGGSETSPPDGNNIIVSVAQYDSNGYRIIEAKSAPFTVVTAPTPPPPTPAPGFIMNPTTVNVTVMASTSVKVFDLTSTGATGFVMYGYPTSHGPGINWLPSSGGIIPGSTIPINIQVNSDITPGTYTGTGIVQSIPSGMTISFPVTVQVTAHQ